MKYDIHTIVILIGEGRLYSKTSIVLTPLLSEVPAWLLEEPSEPLYNVGIGT